MKIIVSPAKTMVTDNEILMPSDQPVYLHETEDILKWLKERTNSELKMLWKCSDSIVKTNAERLKTMNLYENLTPAILAYEGIAYKYMAAAVFQDQEYDYVQKNLRILSGFYGVLKPMDGITPYRLDMNAKCKIGKYTDLYQFWGRKLYDEVRDESGVFINLASKEYAKCISKYVTKKDHFISISFVEESNGKMVTKGTYAKIARGEMVSFMAERKIEDPRELTTFNRLGYVYRKDLSSSDEMVFQRIW